MTVLFQRLRSRSRGRSDIPSLGGGSWLLETGTDYWLTEDGFRWLVE